MLFHFIYKLYRSETFYMRGWTSRPLRRCPLSKMQGTNSSESALNFHPHLCWQEVVLLFVLFQKTKLSE